MDIDAAYEQFKLKEQQLKSALSRCEAEQAEGKIGLQALQEATRLQEERKALAAAITASIDQALKAI